MSLRKLKAWEDAGLLDAATAARIRDWEAGHAFARFSNRNCAFFLLAGLSRAARRRNAGVLKAAAAGAFESFIRAGLRSLYPIGHARGPAFLADLELAAADIPYLEAVEHRKRTHANADRIHRKADDVVA